SALPTLCTANSVTGTLFVNAGVGVYTPGNLFVAELSDENGSFASPLTIGGVNSLVSTYLNYLIPADLTTGNNYSIRIKSTTGTPTPSNPSSPFTINKACLSTGSIPNSTPYCAGDGLDVTASVSGSINGGNVYTAQISDASGSFANPVVIGTLTSGSAGLVSVPSVIPIGTPDGYGYRVRVIGSNSGSTSIANGSISIRQVCVTTSSISQTTYCTGTQITVPFLANATANPGNHFILELSDANGNFTNGFGSFIGTQLNDIAGVYATSVTGTVPFGLPNGTAYKVRIRSTNPSTVGVTSPDLLTIDNTYRWIGGNTTTGTAIEWKNPNNWSCGFVPTSGNDAIIPSSTVGGNFPEINDLTAVARSLYIQNGATVTNLPIGKLTLYGSLVDDGSLISDPSAPVSFAGTSVQSISGVGSLTFGKLSINNVSSGVKSYVPFALKGDFENNGYFDANGNTITFNGSTAQNITGNQLTTFYGLQLQNSSGVNLLNDIYVKGNFSNAGTFNGNGKLTLFNGTPVQTISASAGSFTNFYDIQFGNFGNPAGVYINDNINVLGNFTRVLGNFTCSPSATIFFIGNTVPQVVNAGGVNITFNDINITNPYGVTLSTGTSFSLVGDFINTGKFYSPFTSNIVTFGGNGAQSLGGGGLYSFSNLVINPSAVVTFNSNISLSADFTVNGTLNPNGSTVTFNNDGFQFINSPSPVTFSNIEIVPTSSVFPLTSLNFDGSVTNSGAYFASPTAPGFTVIGSGPQFISGNGTFNLINLTNTNSIGGVTFNSTFDIDGNIVNNGTFLSGPLSTVTFSGLSAQSISGISPVNFNDVLVSNASSVTVLNDLNVQGDFFNNNAVASTTGFTMVDNTVSFNGSGVQFLGGIEPTFFSSVTFDNTSGVNVVTSASVGGVSFVNDGILNCSSGTSFSFASLNPQTIGGSGAINFADVVFANADPSVGVQLATGVNVAGDFINLDGFNANGNTVVFNGFTQDINTSSAQENPTFATISVTGTSVVTLNDTINTKGDFLIGGSFIANDQPVTFNGSALQTIDGAQPIQFADVTFGNSSGFAVNQTASVSSVSFDSGILTMEPGNVFVVTSTSTSAVDRQSGYVAGPIARAVEQPVGQFLFPVGTSTDYRGALVDFSNSAGLSGGILVTHQELATPTFAGLFIGALTTTTPNVFLDSDGTAFTKVYTPVWTITPSTSISGANYAVTFDANTSQIFGASDSITASNVGDLRVVKRPDSGGPWQFLGNSGLATITGGVLSISRTDLVSFSQFAIAGSCSNVTRSSSALTISPVGADSLEASQTALSYRWYKDGEQISNTQKKIKVVLAGDYSVQANLSGCFTNSSPKYTYTPSALISNLGNTKIRLFPNPNRGDITMEFTDVKKEGYGLSVINTIGVEVWSSEFFPTDEKFWIKDISLSDLPSGVYYIKLSQGKNVVVEKLVIEK
ncbi:MAG: T9SS type A sorting domain-containing protein, partial [Cytophagales bacterium]|nr:T9SS type A sorting domain-containing protein [Cytophagales bacterium]